MADIYNCQIGIWQRRFLRELLRAVFALRGRVNFTNLARFSQFHEQTFRRNFRKAFQWVWFNLTVFRLRRHPEEPIIGVFDCSFLPKSGTKTWGIDRFFSSLAGKSKQGLEVSILGIVATESRRAFGVDATQTPPNLSKSEAGAKSDTGGYSRVDFYLEQITDLYDQLADLGVSYWVGDGFYAKQKVFDTVTDLGGDLITRLRSDTNLRYLYTRHSAPAEWQDLQWPRNPPPIDAESAVLACAARVRSTCRLYFFPVRVPIGRKRAEIRSIIQYNHTILGAIHQK